MFVLSGVVDAVCGDMGDGTLIVYGVGLLKIMLKIHVGACLSFSVVHGCDGSDGH